MLMLVLTGFFVQMYGGVVTNLQEVSKDDSSHKLRPQQVNVHKL